MKTSHCIREFGSWFEFLANTGSYRHLWIIRGYDTAEDCSRWFAGGRVLFDEIMDWLAHDDLLTGDIVVCRDDYTAQLGVALSIDTDGVAFVLRWGEFIDQPRAAA